MISQPPSLTNDNRSTYVPVHMSTTNAQVLYLLPVMKVEGKGIAMLVHQVG